MAFRRKESTMKDTNPNAEISRREFVQAAAVAGAGLTLGLPAWAQEAEEKVDELAVAIIGPGSQGINLVNNCLKIPGIRFTAICDIWEYSRKRCSGLLGKYDQKVSVYDDYREMLDKEKHIDAVIVATPDWMHAEHANACLKAGKHVYCEKEMSNTVEKAASMVRNGRETGKLLQIGHQRRSNPRYWHAIKLIENDKILGRITHVNGQWNRAVSEDLGWPERYAMTEEQLAKYGYANMHEFRNWRWFRKYGGGPISDLGAHQID
ncbi:MAG: gfo/Idh/MocA family oxidoreductase, partial [Planctomycetota bacterium]